MPTVLPERVFPEKRYSLPDSPEELKREFRLLAQEAVILVTRGSSNPLRGVDDWLDRLRSEGAFSEGTMEQLLAASRDHLRTMRLYELGIGHDELAERCGLMAARFEEPCGHSFKTPEPEPPGDPRAANGSQSAAMPNSVPPTLAAELEEAERVSDLRLRKMYGAVIRYNWFLEELRALRVATKKHQTPELLKKLFPGFEVWAVLDRRDEEDIAGGDFNPGRFSWSLVKRLEGLTGKDDRTLKNYRRALKDAGLST